MTETRELTAAEWLEAIARNGEAAHRGLRVLAEELAATQAREKALRASFETIAEMTNPEPEEENYRQDDREGCLDAVYSRVCRTLALPTDTTALDQALAEARRQERERCAQAITALLEYIDAIPAEVVQALPGMPGVDRDWIEGLLKD